ncbi:VanZ family protein [Chryseobacterium gambrini]|jgi:glycopeptide antibiotics resistance protein|uniref:VanZ like family protein n=1 Tax=Chryseobacterium gambrini TaxID=373672 RepID=A0A1N7LSZ3_9FLAO|nr:VanZ family protein [Chryseobacterium gambrini]MBL7879736.1 VanZ family protein [Chryseobacterium gambrini]WBV54380.1 VanZ family protein [Chryseobacterium gambrini]SIS76978.1 VanZ like family protein [Chryseobacterium gambrini]
MLKKSYKIIIVPYTLFLLYLMFFGMGRTQMEDNLLTIEPIFSTINFIKGCISWKEIVTIVAGNVVMFIPFGFLGWIFPRLQDLQNLLFTFISAITIVEAIQYFSRMGIFEVDDIILNTFGVFLGFLMKNFIEKRFPNWMI